MKTLREAAALLALTVAAATAVNFLHPRAPKWHEAEEPLRADDVTMKTVAEKWHGGVLWIDARPRAQFEKAHIPGAINISEQELDAQLIENIGLLQDNQKPVVIYCDSSACQASRRVRDHLAQRIPIEEFFVLRGGWQAWLTAQSAK